MQLTKHAEERIKKRGLDRDQVLMAFERGTVLLSYCGARVAIWGNIRAVATRNDKILTAYWRRKKAKCRHRKK